MQQIMNLLMACVLLVLVTSTLPPWLQCHRAQLVLSRQYDPSSGAGLVHTEQFSSESVADHS